jgi:ATP-dependent Lhr-like helicase
VRITGEERLIAADDAGLYRDAFGASPPGGLPSAFLDDVPDALSKLVERYARTHGPFTSAELFGRYGVDVSSALRELELAGGLVRGELRPGGSEREWCDVEVLRRLRRASLAALRKEIEPVGEHALSAFMPSWQGIDRYRSGSGLPTGGGVERLREVLVPLQGLALPVAAWERDVLPRRTGSYSPAWLDTLCASGELVWVGAGPLGRDSGRVALYFRDDVPALGPPPAVGSSSPSATEHALLRERFAAGPCFFTDLLAELDMPTAALTQALWDLVWSGELTNDAWAPLRASRMALVRHDGSGRSAGVRVGRRFGGRSLRGGRFGANAQVQGRWSLTKDIFGELIDVRQRRRTLAELLLERYGVLTREQVLAEGVEGGFSILYGALSELETLGACRRGYFVEGLGGAQFALPGAVERLRAGRADREGSGLVLAAIDPAQPYGAVLPWPRREGQTRRPARVAGAHVVFVDAEPRLYLERGGRGIVTLADAPLDVALRALADAVRARRINAVALERVDGAPAIGSRLEPTLIELGFRQSPRKLTLRA